MCGFIGFASSGRGLLGGDSILREIIQKASKAIAHRGVDASSELSTQPAYAIFFRLAIQDVSNGGQPITSKDGRYSLLLNGEIYNHLELRSSKLKDQSFYSRSDAETLVELVARCGLDTSLNLLNGMFSFLLVDNHERECYLVRDRFGVKPLFYFETQDGVFFSSELSGISQLPGHNWIIDDRSIINYFSFWYSSEPNTFLKGVKHIRPGSYLKISSELNIVQWWNPVFRKRLHNNYNDFCDELETTLTDSVSIRLLSDHKCTMLLSGGVDSGLISAMSKNERNHIIECFSLSSEYSSYDESSYASSQAEHVGLELNRVNNSRPSLSEIINIYSQLDQPLGNASFLGSYRLFNAVSQSGYKVCLTGDGADEIFGGYPTYQISKVSKYWKILPATLQSVLGNLLSSLPVSHNRISFDYKIRQFIKSLPYQPQHSFFRSVFTPDQLTNLLGLPKHDILNVLTEPLIQSLDKCKKAGLSNGNLDLHLDFDTYLLNDHLPKIDRSSMLNGVEARSPFLDYRIYQLAFNNPDYYKYNLRTLKKPLRRLGDHRLCHQVKKTKKKGLTLPIASWLMSGFGDDALDLIMSSFKLKQLINTDYVYYMFQNHRRRKVDHSRELWAVLVLAIWLEKTYSDTY